jgi:hypothetical protein
MFSTTSAELACRSWAFSRRRAWVSSANWSILSESSLEIWNHPITIERAVRRQQAHAAAADSGDNVTNCSPRSTLISALTERQQQIDPTNKKAGWRC